MPHPSACRLFGSLTAANHPTLNKAKAIIKAIAEDTAVRELQPALDDKKLTK